VTANGDSYRTLNGRRRRGCGRPDRMLRPGG